MTVILYVCCLQYTSAQTSFFNIYTNYGYDFGEGITQLSDDSYLVTGGSSSFEEAPSQAFLLKTDAYGNRLWSKAYGGIESDWGRRVFTMGNAIYVAGYTNSFGTGSFDFYFFKTDQDGALIYERIYGGSKFEKLHSAVMIPSDTSFVLIGETTSNDTEVEDIYMVRVDSNGDVIWTRQFGSSGVDVARSIKMINDTTMMIVGEYYDTTAGIIKAMMLKMNIDGTTDWMKLSGIEGNYCLNDFDQIGNQFFAVGQRKITLNGVDKSNLLRVVFDVDGNIVSNEQDNFVEYSHLSGIVNYGFNNRFYVIEQALLSTVSVYPDGEDMVVHAYHPDLTWSNTVANVSKSGQDQGNQIIRTSDGGAIVVGYNTYYGTGGANVVLVKLGSNEEAPVYDQQPVEGSLVFKNELAADFKLSLYPNPVRSVLSVSSVETGEKQLQIRDVSGKLMKEALFYDNIQLDFGNYDAGVYMIDVTVNGYSRSVKIIKQ